MRSRRVLALAVVAAFAAPASPSARAEDGGAAESFRRAELAERALGDLERAVDLYRAAASAAPDAPARAMSELRAANCLRRLGRADEARALAAPLAAGRPGVPAEVRLAAEAEVRALDASAPSAPDAPKSPREPPLAEHELEREEMRVALEGVVERAERAEGAAKGLEADVADLANRLREKDAQIDALRREAASAVDLNSPEEILELRRRELERRRRQDVQIGGAFLKTARLLHRDGRFAEAQAYLNEALERDPENAEARALLDRVSAPLGDREALFQRTLEVLTLAREVRAARRAAEIASLVEEGRRRQARDDFLGSVVPLERALAVLEALDADGDEARGGPGLRDEVLRLLQAATARGVPRAPAPAAPADDPDASWMEALRELLAGAGREVAQGLELRFHDLGPLAAGAVLPPVPVGAAPEGWTVSARAPDGAALHAARFRADERRAFTAPGASLRAVGTTLVALCDRETQRRLAGRLETMRRLSPPASMVRVHAWRIDESSVAALLARRDVADVPAEGDARAAVLSPGDVEALLAATSEAPSLGSAMLRCASLRAFRLAPGGRGAVPAVDVLPAAGEGSGLAVRVESSISRGRAGAPPRLRASCLAGGAVAQGGGVVVFGIADPTEPRRDVAVLVRIGATAATAPSPPSLAPEGQGASELFLPAHVAAVEDPLAAPELVPDHPWATRREALLRRLRDRARGASTVEVRGDRVLVVGPEEARRGAREFLAQMGAVRLPQSFEVRVFQVPPVIEQQILVSAPRLAPAASGAFAWCVLRNDAERRKAELLAASAKGEVPLLEPRIAAPATGRRDAVRVLRSLYTSGTGVAPPGVAGFGRGEAAWVEEGLSVSVRPFGRTADGRVDLDLGARARWISDRGQRQAETADGTVRVLEPATSSWWGDVATTLGPGESVLLAKARSPFATGESDRLVVLVRPVE